MDKTIFCDGAFLAYVQDLIDLKKIEGKEAGIAQLAIDKGYSFLSKKTEVRFRNGS